MANVGRAVSSVGGLFLTLQERYSNASSVGPGLYFQPVTINKYILCLSCMEDWSKCQDNIETRHVSQSSWNKKNIHIHVHVKECFQEAYSYWYWWNCRLLRQPIKFYSFLFNPAVLKVINTVLAINKYINLPTKEANSAITYRIHRIFSNGGYEIYTKS